MKGETFYKIGTLAKRFHITPQTIRFYEEQGLLNAARNEYSATRRYSSRSLKWLSSIRRYLELGFGVREIQGLFERDTLEGLDEALNAQSAVNREEIKRLERRGEAIDRMRSDIFLARTLLHRCRLETSPTMLLLLDQEGDELNESREVEALLTIWLGELSSVSSAVLVDRRAIETENPDMGRRSGFCIEESLARRIDLPVNGAVIRLTERMCIHTVARRSDDDSAIDFVNRFAAENHLVICGDALARCLAKVGEAQCQQEGVKPRAIYYEYWIPVERT